MKVKVIKPCAPFVLNEEYEVTQSPFKDRWRIIGKHYQRGYDIPKKVTDHKR